MGYIWINSCCFSYICYYQHVLWTALHSNSIRSSERLCLRQKPCQLSTMRTGFSSRMIHNKLHSLSIDEEFTFKDVKILLWIFHPKMDHLNLSAIFGLDAKLLIHENMLKNLSLLMINSSQLQVDILDAMSPGETIALTALYIPIFFIGFLGNITIVLIIGISPPLRNSTNWYLFNLAISDLCGKFLTLFIRTFN